MRRAVLVGLALAVSAGCPAVVHAVAGFDTVIDLDYTYGQTNQGGEVNAATSFNQKYEAQYQTSLTSAVDLAGTVRLEIRDLWATDAVHTSELNPTLELVAIGIRSGARITYQGTVANTDAFQETAEHEVHANSLSAELQLTPLLWPEIRLQYARNRSYQLQVTDSVASNFSLSLQKDIYGLRLGLDITRNVTDEVLPVSATSETLQWLGKAAYQELLFGGTEFEVDYQITEFQSEQRTHGDFTDSSKGYAHQLRTRMRNSWAVLSQLRLGVSWEYGFEQDLLALEYDYKVDNEYTLDVRWDILPRLKFNGGARRQTNRTVNDVGEGEERSTSDTLSGTFDADLAYWLQLAGRVEFKRDGDLSEVAGGAVDRTEERKFEVIAKNRVGDFWDLTLSLDGSEDRTDGTLTERRNGFKADLSLNVLDVQTQQLIVHSSYQVTRNSSWAFGIDSPVSQTRSSDARFGLDYRLRLFNMLKAEFSHEYGVTVGDSANQTLSVETTPLTFSESTGLKLALEEIVKDLLLDGDIQRTATDTEGDTEPMLVDVSYALNLGWKWEDLVLASTFQYNDKGSGSDDMSINARIGYSYQRLTIGSEYQFSKILADDTNETRRLNLKLILQF